MPARTTACRRLSRRTEWSAWSLVPADGHILTAARGAMQGRSRPPPIIRAESAPARGLSRAPLLPRLLLHLQRVFDGFEGSELNVVQLALDLLDLADLDVLDDVPRL